MITEPERSLDIVGAPQRPLQCFTHNAAAEDEFTTDPELLADQADSFEFLTLGDDSLPEHQSHFYVLSRAVRIEAPGGFECDVLGRRWGVHVVAYPCDDAGRISSWESRYELQAVTLKIALAKFEFLWQNDLLHFETLKVPFEFEDAQRGF